MIDPALAFAIFFGLVALVAAVAWPRRGLWARAEERRRASERVRLEDALKHLLDAERSGRRATLETMAGRLELSRGAASEILTRLVDRGLAEATSSGFELTDPGRTYALRIVRTHRLWERYLADRTGVPAAEWHAEAERVEHLLSEEEAEALATRLGDPRYDPHGDPIPTAKGEIPERLRTTLSELEAGESAVVRHLEDEPREVFDRLLEIGLAPGETLELVERTAEGRGSGRVRIRVRGEEYGLGPVAASSVTVERTEGEKGAAAREPRRTLEEAGRGEAVRVLGISPACQGPQRRRLLDLGVVPGTVIVPELAGSSGDPVAYRIRGALIALRRDQARWIEVDAEPSEKAG